MPGDAAEPRPGASGTLQSSPASTSREEPGTGRARLDALRTPVLTPQSLRGTGTGAAVPVRS